MKINRDTRRVGIGTVSPNGGCDLTLGDAGVLSLVETTTPTAYAGFGAIYTQSDNLLYFQDGAGTEHVAALLDVSQTFTAANEFTSTTGALNTLKSTRSNIDANLLFTSLQVQATKTTDMGDGFGASVTFFIEDNLGVSNTIGALGFERSGADNSGDFVIQTVTGGGASTERFRVSKEGNVSFSGSLTNNNGVIYLAETTTPTPVANYGAIYTQSDNLLYFQDGAGTEHELVDANTSSQTISATKIFTAQQKLQQGTIALLLGADNSATTITNSALKFGRIAVPHYLTAEEPLALIFGRADTYNEVVIGGGSSIMNTAQFINFYTASDSTTVAGTLTLQINDTTTTVKNELTVEKSTTITPTAASPTLTLGRLSGNPSIKATSDAAGYMLIESAGLGTGVVGLNFYNADAVWLANGGGSVTIGVNTTFNSRDLTLGNRGVLGLKETTTPTAGAGYGAVYTQSDNVLYFQDGAGSEKQLIDSTSTQTITGTKKFSTTASTILELETTNNATSPVLQLTGQRTADGTIGRIIAYNGVDSMGYIYFNREGADNSSSISFGTQNAGTIDTRMFIDEAGNVGINTTTPENNLHVVGGIKVVSNAEKFELYENDVAEADAYIKLTNLTGFSSRLLPLFNMKASGASIAGYRNAIIADSADDVAGDYSMTISGRVNNSTVSNAGIFRVNNLSTELMVIQNDGKVGLGTTNPLDRLQLGTKVSAATATPESISTGATYSNTAGTNYKLKLYDTGTNIAGIGVSFGQMDYGVWDDSTVDHVFYRGTTELLRITGDGKLGINTTSPDYDIQVEKSTLPEINVYATSGASSSLFSMGTNNSTRAAFMITYGSTHATQANELSLKNAYGDLTLYTGTAASASERVRVTSSGDVGIGTTNPQEKLHVSSSGTTRVEVESTGTSSAIYKMTNTTSSFGIYAGSSGMYFFDYNASATRLFVSNAGLFQTNGDSIRIATSKTPASASATGSAGEIAWDTSYIYVCTATDTWKRAAIASW